DLMRPVQAVVNADMSLRDVVRNYMTQLHNDRFPVVRDQTLLGYISAEEIAAIDRSSWPAITAERLARPYKTSEILSPDQSAFTAFQMGSGTGRGNLPVFNGRRLVGYLFMQDVSNYLQRFMSSGGSVRRTPGMHW